MIILSLPLTVAIGRYGILPLLVIGASFHARRIYQDNKRLGILVIIKMLLGIGLLLISALTALVKPTIWWVHWIGSTSFHFSILFHILRLISISTISLIWKSSETGSLLD